MSKATDMQQAAIQAVREATVAEQLAAYYRGTNGVDATAEQALWDALRCVNDLATYALEMETRLANVERAQEVAELQDMLLGNPWNK